MPDNPRFIPDTEPTPIEYYASFQENRNRESRDLALALCQQLVSPTRNRMTSDFIHISDSELEEVIEAVSETIENFGYRTCRPGPRQVHVTDPEFPCWKSAKNGVFRSGCYYDACPFVKDLKTKHINPDLVVNSDETEDISNF